MLSARAAALLLLLAAAAHARDLYFENHLGETIWVGSQGASGQPNIADGGWVMDPNAQVTQQVPDNWSGRFWARTGCDASTNHCETGDCGNVLQCNGAGGAPPATLVEMTLQGDQGNDFYDISNVDGFNVPASMTPTDQTGDDYWCTSASCNTNINDQCPPELQDNVNGQTVGCNSACVAFNTDQYCCRGAYGTPETCNPDTWPTNYAADFKTPCPGAYSYAYDDATSTFKCANTNYRIVFGV